MRSETWALPTPIWARPTAPSNSLNKRLSIAREIGDRRGEGNALGNLGLAYADLGETDAPSSSMNKHCSLFARLAIAEAKVMRSATWVDAYAAPKPRPAAPSSFMNRRLTIAREIGDRRGEGNALWNMSLVLDQLGERAQAIPHAEQALRFYRADRRSHRHESARATCRLARANKHVKLTSSLSANGNLSLCDFEPALPSIVESHRRQL